jgi:hypothetical protein
LSFCRRDGVSRTACGESGRTDVTGFTPVTALIVRPAPSSYPAR